MGSGASTAEGQAAGGGGHNHHGGGAPSMHFAAALSSKAQSVRSLMGLSGRIPQNKRIIRVPLHIAVQAVILLQRTVRAYLARKLVRHLRELHSQQVASATNYLNNKMGIAAEKTGSAKGFLIRRSLSGDSQDSPTNKSFHQSFQASTRFGSSHNSTHGGGGFPSASGRHQPPMSASKEQRSGTAKSRQVSTAFSNFSGLSNAPNPRANDTAYLEFYPYVGFVAKTRLANSQKKVFINICHSPHIDYIAAAPLREWIDNTHHDEDGQLKYVDVVVTDIIIPTAQFDEYVKYKDGVGLIALSESGKEFIALNCISYWNSLYQNQSLDDEEEGNTGFIDEDYEDFFPGSNNPGNRQSNLRASRFAISKPSELATLTDDSDYIMENDFKLPKIKRGYIGHINLLLLNKSFNTISYIYPTTLREHPYSLTSMVNAWTMDTDAIIPPAEVQWHMSLSWSSVTIPMPGSEEANKKKKKKDKKKSKKLKIEEGKDERDDAEDREDGKEPESKVAESDEDREEDEEKKSDVGTDLTKEQIDYVNQVKTFKEGYKVYVEMYMGMLYIYKQRISTATTTTDNHSPQTPKPTTSPTKDGKKTAKGDKRNHTAKSSMTALLSNEKDDQTFPYKKIFPAGEKEITRMLLANMEVNTDYDTENDIFALTLELVPDEYDTPFVMEKYFNRFTVKKQGKGGSSSSGPGGSGQKPETFGSNNHNPLDNTDASKNYVLRNTQKIIFQYLTFSEMMTWKLLFQSHIDFSFDSLRKSMQTGTMMKFHNHVLTSTPPSKAFYAVELLKNTPNSRQPLRRKKFYLKVDRGYLGIFIDDATVTPSWSTSLEIISLKYCRMELKTKKIIRSRKFMTRIRLITRDNSRDFYYHSDNETDSELNAIIKAWEENIDYANSMLYRYLFPWMKENDLLKHPQSNNVLGGGSSQCTCVTGAVQVQITVPDPSTSDDDSDIEERELRKQGDEMEAAFFRVVKPKPAAQNPTGANSRARVSIIAANTAGDKTSQGTAHTAAAATASFMQSTTNSRHSVAKPSLEKSVSGTGGRFNASNNHSHSTATLTTVASSATLNSQEDDDKDDEQVYSSRKPEERFIEWKETLNSRFEIFVNNFFHGHLLYIQESHLLVFLHEVHVIMVLNISRCLEIVHPKKAMNHRLGGGNSPKRIGGKKIADKNSKLYDLDSSDEDDDGNNSDRDYDEFDDPDFLDSDGNSVVSAEDTTATVFMLTLQAYDGRTYKLKFYNKHDYFDWRQLFYDHDQTFSRNHPLSTRNSGIIGNMGRLSGLPLQYIPAPTASINSATSPRMNSASASKESHLSTPSMLNLANRQSSAPVFDATSGLEDKANLEVTYDNENTRKFSKQLKTNEKVIACGTVMKHERVMAHTNATNAPKQRRILLVTDLPRLIFIDTIGNVVRGSVEVPSESKMDIKALDGNDFEASIGGTPHRFSCLELPEKDPKFWVHKIRCAATKAV